MITIDQARNLLYRQNLYHVSQRASDGSARRVRVNGAVKTWKRMPTRWEVPVKYGLYRSLRIGSHMIGIENASEWTLVEPK